MIGTRLEQALRVDPDRRRLISSPFFDRIAGPGLSRGQVTIFLGQWWHPLHYFPVFLSRLIAVTPGIEAKAAIAKILFQELGEGDPARAHEVIYLDTMAPLGFEPAAISGAAPLPATARLVAAYAEASSAAIPGLGFMYGTEVADLAMVSAIGTAVRTVTGVRRLPWVDIHVQQEPEHVSRATDTVSLQLSEAEESTLLASAQSMWRHWIAFFEELDRAVFPAQASAAAS